MTRDEIVAELERIRSLVEDATIALEELASKTNIEIIDESATSARMLHDEINEIPRTTAFNDAV